MLVRRLKRRGVSITIEAHGEVLFDEAGDVGRWTNRFSHRVMEATKGFAPSNKRPRWAYYGPALKETFRASTSYQPVRMRVYAIVGSTAPYAIYVDQGTSSFNAKILPPTRYGAPNLYEWTYRPGYGDHPLGKIRVRGQRAQHFFDKGLKAGFQSMGMRSYQLPGEGVSGLTGPGATSLTGIEGVLDAIAANAGGFRVDLAQWRAWRDAAWAIESRRRSPRLSRPRHRSTPAEKRALSAARSRRYRERQKAKSPAVRTRAKKATTNKSRITHNKKGGHGSVQDRQAAAIDAFISKNPKAVIIRRNPGGLVVRSPRTGKPVQVSWSKLFGLL